MRKMKHVKLFSFGKVPQLKSGDSNLGILTLQTTLLTITLLTTVSIAKIAKFEKMKRNSIESQCSSTLLLKKTAYLVSFKSLKKTRNKYFQMVTIINSEKRVQ